MVHRIVAYTLLSLCLLLASGDRSMAGESMAKPAQPASSTSKEEATARVLYVGWASADITPPQPVALVGQLSKRISQSVLDPLTATVLALETRADDGQPEQAIMVSCDMLYIRRPIQEKLRALIIFKSLWPVPCCQQR